jgi:D-aminopeptidase
MIVFLASVSDSGIAESGKRLRDYGIIIGTLQTGRLNAITDVPGVLVGQVSIVEGSSVRTGVTAILPHGGNIFQEKVPAAIYVGNGFGKMTGVTQVKELGELETPIILTNTLSVPIAARALIDYTLSQPENRLVRSVNPVVGETNDGWLNDIRGNHVKAEHVLEAIRAASSGMVQEGTVGAGTGTVCFSYKGGIGTASRQVKVGTKDYVVGILIQSNFGGELQVAGIPVGVELKKGQKSSESFDGSCMMIVATDAPVDARQLKRLARRAMLGLGRTGGISSHGSGDYVLSLSTALEMRILHQSRNAFQEHQYLRDDHLTPLFRAVIEATEEAILNSLFAATSVTGFQGHTAQALPVKKVLQIMKSYKPIKVK